MDKIIVFKTVSVSLSLLFFTYLVEGNMFDLRDIKFDSNYNKFELPPSHDGKPLLVSNITNTIMADTDMHQNKPLKKVQPNVFLKNHVNIYIYHIAWPLLAIPEM